MVWLDATSNIVMFLCDRMLLVRLEPFLFIFCMNISTESLQERYAKLPFFKVNDYFFDKASFSYQVILLLEILVTTKVVVLVDFMGKTGNK